MTAMICPMLSALKPVDEQGRPVNRECIYEGCRFFNREQRDCNLMIGSLAMIRASQAGAGASDLGRDMLRYSQDVQGEVRQAGQAILERVAGVEGRIAAFEAEMTRIGAALAQVTSQVASIIEVQQRVADRLLEDLSLLTATSSRTEEAVARTEPAMARAEQAAALAEQASSGLGESIGRVEAAMRAVGEGNRTVMQAIESRMHHDKAELRRRQQEEAVECNNRGVALYYRAALDAAHGAFKKALELKPDYAEAWNNLGLVLSKLGREKEAVEAFQKALTLDPKMGETYNNLGFLFHSTSQFDRALQMFGRAVENAADSSVAFTNLGNTFYAMKQSDKAVEAWRRALELDPLNETARRGLRMFEQDPAAN